MISIKNFGPIKDVNLELGDLTILLGAQASGKSLLLQMFKLAKDRKSIVKRLDNYGFIVKGNADNLLNRYLGEFIILKGIVLIKLIFHLFQKFLVIN